MTFSLLTSNEKGCISRWTKLTTIVLWYRCCCCSTSFAFVPAITTTTWLLRQHSAFGVVVTRRFAVEEDAIILGSSDATTANSTLFYSSYNQTASNGATASIGTARFGDVVSMRRPGTVSSSSSSSSGTVWADPVVGIETAPAAATATDSTGSFQEMQKKRQMGVAIASIALAILNFVWQWSHPITAISILAEMERESAPVSVIGHNDKPTLVDFWAPWCENCKLMAPTLQAVEQEYKNKVNFVMINGDKAEAWPYIDAFRVDAIPHMALVSADGKVETALIGPVPKKVLEADLDTLLENAQVSNSKKDLPFQMLDVFMYEPEQRKVDFASSSK